MNRSKWVCTLSLILPLSFSLISFLSCISTSHISSRGRFLLQSLSSFAWAKWIFIRFQIFKQVMLLLCSCSRQEITFNFCTLPILYHGFWNINYLRERMDIQPFHSRGSLVIVIQCNVHYIYWIENSVEQEWKYLWFHIFISVYANIDFVQFQMVCLKIVEMAKSSQTQPHTHALHVAWHNDGLGWLCSPRVLVPPARNLWIGKWRNIAIHWKQQRLS